MQISTDVTKATKIRIILEKLTVAHLIHKSPVLLDSKVYHHVCVIPCQMNPLSKLFTRHVFLDLPYRLLPSSSTAQQPFPNSPTRATKPPHPFIFVILIFCGHKLLSSSIRNFLHPPVTSSLTGPSSFLSNLPSNTTSSSLTIKQVSHPYTTLTI